ncbi:MAG: hypothetical protein K9M57_04795 [Phycisphaerae bacterium]|nr:hypothetical protein [Phycisphaerae bacterium]
MVNKLSQGFQVHREARDKLASTIAAYMRGEIRSDKFDEIIFCDIVNINDFKRDKAGWNIAFDLWGYYDDLIDHNFLGTKEQWDYFKRLIAFLKTDYSLKKREIKKTVWHPVWLYRILLLLLVLLIGLAIYKYSIIIAYLAWLGLGMLFCLLAFCVKRYNEKNVKSEEIIEIKNYSPFHSENDWEAHEYLVKDYLLPEYNSDLYNVPLRSKKSDKLMNVFFIFSLAFLWPLYVCFQLFDFDDVCIEYVREEI